MKHITVLLDEAVEVLNIKEGDVVVDATLGAGGHTLKLLEKVGESGKVIGIDLDQQAIEEFEKKIKKIDLQNKTILTNRLILVNDNFKNLQNIINRLYVRGDIKQDKVDGILADLGWRIEQVQDVRYGMSFQQDAPLNMRMDGQKGGLTAWEIINEWSEEELATIFKELGEEQMAGKIAREIILQRENKKIDRTGELAELIKNIRGNKERGKNHPATKVFQALRIVVNEELGNLNIFLEQSVELLKSKGRLAIISFHSLEDRLVKNFFRAKARGCVCPKEIPVCVCDNEPEIKLIRRKGIKPSKEELKNNRRARSARLRVGEKV